MFSGLNNQVEPLNALLSGKESWPSDPVTLIATYDTTEFNHWISENRDQIGEF